jgi:hypothetical protein
LIGGGGLLAGAGQQQAEEGIGEPVLEPGRAPAPVTGEAAEQGRVHQRPHGVDRGRMIHAGAPRRPAEQAVYHPGGHDLPLGHQLRGDRGDARIDPGGLQGRQRQPGSPLRGLGELPGAGAANPTAPARMGRAQAATLRSSIAPARHPGDRDIDHRRWQPGAWSRAPAPPWAALPRRRRPPRAS